MRVLISAYACEPGKGSEPGVGWNWSLQAARLGANVHVITRANNRGVIERANPRPPNEITFHYFDLPRPFVWLKRRTGYYGMVAYYYLWQLASIRLARRLHRRHRFQIVHHVTFVNDWMPSGLAFVKTPFVWGPVGGSGNLVPVEIERSLPARARRYERVRRVMQRAFARFDPFVGMTRRRAQMIVTFTDAARGAIPRRHRRKARPFIHIGVSEDEVPLVDVVPPDDRFVVVTGSRLVHWKGFDLLIEGFARLAASDERKAYLDITGDGPFREQLEGLVDRLSIRDRVRFLGHLPSRNAVFEVVARGHLYALPTLRDGPPVAILEAMAMGKPILCLAFGSTAELVPDDAGLKVPLSSRARTIEEIAARLTWAAAHQDVLREKGARARQYAFEHHSWARVGSYIEEIYREVMRSQARGAKE